MLIDLSILPASQGRVDVKFLVTTDLSVGVDYFVLYVCAGIERAEFMVKFLEDLVYPLTLLTSADQVKDFLTEHDVSIFILCYMCL